MSVLVMTGPARRGAAMLVAISLCAGLPRAVTAQTLPPLAPEPSGSRLSTLERVRVERFRFVGNSVYSDEALSRVVAPYAGQTLTVEGLNAAREAVTELYRSDGYVNSGALLPDQEIEDGIVTLQVVEGRLTSIDVRTDGRLRAGYVAGRLMTSDPLDADELRRRLHLLQRNPLISRLDGDLTGGAAPGEAVLRVDVEEARPFFASLQFDNYRPPTIGSERLMLELGHRNLTGNGDLLGGRVDLVRPGDSHLFYYAIPVTARDTVVSVEVERSDAEVQTALFDLLDIRSEFQRWSLAVEQPVYRSHDLRDSLVLSLKLDRRHLETFVLGERFSLSPGVRDGESDVTVLELAQQWVSRDVRQVLAARSSFHLGLDAFGATRNDGPLPDGRFFLWIGQLQWTAKLDFLDSEIAVRGITQLSDSPLLPSERFSIGGHATVRGYRENLLTRDNAAVASVEWRVPVATLKIPELSTGPDDGRIELAAFYDYGRGWNREFPTFDPQNVSSVGVGLRWAPSAKLTASLYWGHALRDVDLAEDDNLQDDGLQFRIGFQMF